MSGVANGDGTQPREQFPGILNPTSTGAMGSVPTRTPPPDAAASGFVTGSPGGSGQIVPVTEQTGHGRTASTAMPGQEDSSVISGGDPDHAYTDTGAESGSDHTDAWGRFSWQQGPGG